MTQSELQNKIFRLQACSSNMAAQIADLLVMGDKSCKTKTDTLTLLNGYIYNLLKYNLATNAKNCLTEQEFKNMYYNAIVLCKLCDCEQ